MGYKSIAHRVKREQEKQTCDSQISLGDITRKKKNIREVKLKQRAEEKKKKQEKLKVSIANTC